MRIRCPHCHHALEIVPDAPSEPVKCPSCGSKLPGPDETIERRPEPVKSVGHFELLERVGRGHFGDVYRARDTKLNRTVAVKIPRTDRTDDATLRLFLHEARAAAQLRHAHIVRVYDVDRDGELVYIVSDFIHGVTLADRMESRRFDPRAAAELCATVAEALHYAHEAGVVHRDLKPSNIMLDDEGQPHLMDFGLAKQNASEISITTSGDILGTPAYMSPEQARGDSRHADRRSDVYSLGVVLYQMISGEHPFAGDSVTLLRRVASDEPAPAHRISDKLPRDLATICLTAISKEPSRRYATAQEMADDLRRFVRGDPIKARRESIFERGWRWARRNPAVALSSAAALAAVIVLAAVLSRGVVSSERLPAQDSRRVSITTEPTGASMAFIPLGEKDGLPQPERIVKAKGKSPVQVDLSAGDYLVVAYFDDGRFHEVQRRVPGRDPSMPEAYNHLYWKILPDGTVEWALVKIPDATVTAGMVLFEGQEEFMVGAPNMPAVPLHRRSMRSFYLDPTEVTVGEYRQTSSLPSVVSNALPLDTDAMAHVWYKEALNHAELMGKRLPDEFDYEFAATLGGKQPTPPGLAPDKITQWKIGDVRGDFIDQLPTQPPVFGLNSNVAEWTSSLPLPYPANKALGQPDPERPGSERVVRGGPGSVIKGEPSDADWSGGPRARQIVNVMMREPGLGFRCARSVKPRLAAEDFSDTISTAGSVVDTQRR